MRSAATAVLARAVQTEPQRTTLRCSLVPLSVPSFASLRSTSLPALYGLSTAAATWAKLGFCRPAEALCAASATALSSVSHSPIRASLAARGCTWQSTSPSATTWTTTGWYVFSGSPPLSCAYSTSCPRGKSKSLFLAGMPDRSCTRPRPARSEGCRREESVGFWPAGWSKPRDGGASNRHDRPGDERGGRQGGARDGAISHSGSPNCGPLLPWILTCHHPPQSSVEPSWG